MPHVEAYGTARPGRTWRAVAEVKGRVVMVHNDLKSGSILPAGTVVLEIDQTDYELTTTRLTADIAQAKANLAELGGFERPALLLQLKFKN